ncbi:MAG TPA: RNA 2',3'-cyclic phosphodiesterase, partial [Bacteroidetes bacterium]|nr:RNA 2',3'-cyclic phosphodiesterase [Bacteroidota bacterium]
MRAFVALELPRALKERLIGLGELLDAGDARIRWVREEAMHLTLVFLGDQPDDVVASMAAEVVAAAKETGPLQLGVGGLGAFPARRKPRVIWVGVRPNENLARLQARLAARARESG